MFLTVENVKKSYGKGDAAVKVLDGVSTQLEKGKICTDLHPASSLILYGAAVVTYPHIIDWRRSCIRY